MSCAFRNQVIDDDFPIKSFEELGYSVIVYGQKSYNGVAIISKYQPDNILRGFEKDYGDEETFKKFLNQKRLISADIYGLKIINVYVPNGSSLNSDKFEYKINWLNYLASYIDEQEKKGVLICLLEILILLHQI